ncbi:alpha-beta hydrolase superfamily lysophospholipase [Xenorhabdus cabanillasii]|uniref:Alpha-beta hydrolase superfamily lysophospholipase n=1 Tax=Xenorhabdus cabanillasii TaxID=351673 RepID=A0A3D9UB51_9GAMM|nr:alpha/beta fold hydrolase [Xenorhabdus cabanillasii]REF26407.1 alpha-beta hydrolase superfamily lysophospholipase [Xenorhabdus cabanillasii]
MISNFNEFGNSTIHTHTSSDGYTLHYRSWGNECAKDIIVMLHGGVSHSGWQYPLGNSFTNRSPYRFVALDRRGSGLNAEKRGHIVSVQQELNDVASLLLDLVQNGAKIHLAGWCFGGQIAALVAAQSELKGKISNLIMITPGFWFTERYGDILVRTTHSVKQVLSNINYELSHDIDYFPVPLAVEDFTDDPDLQNALISDCLLLRNVTLNTIDVWQELADLSRTDLISSSRGIPVMCILANRDRLVDNHAVAEYLISRYGKENTDVIWLDGPHAIQFSEADRIVKYICSFLR